jgi:hypothetical protein
MVQTKAISSGRGDAAGWEILVPVLDSHVTEVQFGIMNGKRAGSCALPAELAANVATTTFAG